MSIDGEAATPVAGPRCSQLAADLGEPLAGTAPVAQGWLVIEQPGPWGRAALLESRLPEGVGTALTQHAADSGTTVVLVRRPGRSADADAATGGVSRRFWVAHTSPGGVFMRGGDVDDVRDLLTIDLRAVARGELPPMGRRDAEPLLLVCTNAKRDACCALLGRPLAADLSAAVAAPDRVWESSHLGGHRFAPTALLLPWGTVHGGLDLTRASALLDEAAQGRLLLNGYRGRTALRRWMQAAEIAVRESEGILELHALQTLRVTPTGTVVPPPTGVPSTPAPDAGEAEVRHVDGRTWRVAVRRATLPARPESCGADPVESDTFLAGAPEPAPAWR